MKITLVDGSMSNYKKPDFISELLAELIKNGSEVNLLKANEMKIKYCTGCWSCWWKTPGECPQKDDMPIFYKSYMKSDWVLHFSPMEMGFISSRLKTINDRSIPLVHPYLDIVQNECHHKKRYEKYPLMGLIVDPCDADNEDLQITNDLYKRLALNLKSELKLFKTTKHTIEEIIYAISNI